MSTISPADLSDLAVLRGITQRLRGPSREPFRRLCLQLAEALEIECAEEYRPQLRHIAAALREAWELRCNACGEVYSWPRYDHRLIEERITDPSGSRRVGPLRPRGDCPACAR